jgi:hypothetical protein
VQAQFLDRLPGAQQRDPAAGQDAFLDCGARRMHSIVEPGAFTAATFKPPRSLLTRRSEL